MAKNTATFGITDTAPGTERLAYRLMWSLARFDDRGQRPSMPSSHPPSFGGWPRLPTRWGTA